MRYFSFAIVLLTVVFFSAEIYSATTTLTGNTSTTLENIQSPVWETGRLLDYDRTGAQIRYGDYETLADSFDILGGITIEVSPDWNIYWIARGYTSFDVSSLIGKTPSSVSVRFNVNGSYDHLNDTPSISITKGLQGDTVTGTDFWKFVGKGPGPWTQGEEYAHITDIACNHPPQIINGETTACGSNPGTSSKTVVLGSSVSDQACIDLASAIRDGALFKLCFRDYVFDYLNVAPTRAWGQMQEIWTQIPSGVVYLDVTYDDTSAAAPDAEFTISPTLGTSYPCKVEFRDKSINIPTQWSWDFDGDSIPDSTSQNPSYTFETSGTKTISLTAVNSSGSDTVSHSITIQNNQSIVPSFTCSGDYTLSFTDLSYGGDATEWVWDFGDSTICMGWGCSVCTGYCTPYEDESYTYNPSATSSSQNPSHTYRRSGTYKVGLYVKNATSESYIIKDITIPYVAPDLTTITVTPSSPSISVGGTQQFTATGTYDDDSTSDITSLVTWVSSSTGVATITSGGLATGVAPGSTTISATLGGVSGNTTLTVSYPLSISGGYSGTASIH